MHKKSFQTIFEQLFSIEVFITLFFYANFKKEHYFLPKCNQISIAKTLNGKFGNLNFLYNSTKI